MLQRVLLLLCCSSMHTQSFVHIPSVVAASSSSPTPTPPSSSRLLPCLGSRAIQFASSLLGGSSNGESSSLSSNHVDGDAVIKQDPQTDLDFYHSLVSCQDEQLAPLIHSSLNVLADSFRLYGPINVVASYNGGKDADVIMQLMRAAMAKYNEDTRKSKEFYVNAKFIYFAVTDEFPDVIRHIRYQEKFLGLDITKSPSGIVQGITEYMDQPHMGNLAFVLGTRKGDPNCGDQQYFSPSSSWMPPFMRVNPILEWTYGDVWKFLRLYNLKYCVLYDQVHHSNPLHDYFFLTHIFDNRVILLLANNLIRFQTQPY